MPASMVTLTRFGIFTGADDGLGGGSGCVSHLDGPEAANCPRGGANYCEVAIPEPSMGFAAAM